MLAFSAVWLEWEGGLGRDLMLPEKYIQIAKSSSQKRGKYYACIKGLRGYTGGSPYTELYH